ncbi:MAG: CinA family nicotinamide mononucleotide deamidase-related protein [Candidatus Riflebacteria bacterium]|nr:CinA family nicotinamide mononucleotide deamidase-related protein [Candidatus Riflebacteria bacterium]
MKPLVAELISVGTELLLGEILDTNAVFLAQSLKENGIFLYFRSTVGDNIERIKTVLRLALSRSDLIITTGGLGPTPGDVTRESIASLLDEKVEVHDGIKLKIQSFFEKRGIKMPENNLKQAWVIPSSEILENPIGTAPGWFVKTGGKTIVSLPGPPHEMRRMWQETALPKIARSEQNIYSQTLHTFGLGESLMAEKLKDFLSMSHPTFALYARPHGIDIRIAASTETYEKARSIVEEMKTEILKQIGEFIYSQNDERLTDKIYEKLEKSGKNFALVEGFTCGKMAGLLTVSEKCSKVFKGGIVFSQEVFVKKSLNNIIAESKAFFGVDWLLINNLKRDNSMQKHGDYIELVVVEPNNETHLFSLPIFGDRSYMLERAAYWSLIEFFGILSKIEENYE